MKKLAKRIKVVFRNDDPSAISDPDHEAAILRMFSQYGLPQTFGVVPCMTRGDIHCMDQAPFAVLEPGSAMAELLRKFIAETGSEIALHGKTHQTNRFSNPRRREYFEFRGLHREEQERMIVRGRSVLSGIFGQEIVTFIPPWNRLDDLTLEVLESLDFRAISCESYEHASDKLLHFGCNCGIESFSETYRKIKSHGNEVFLNFLYHSSTTRSSQQIEALERVIKRVATDSEVEVLTIRDAVIKYEPQLRAVNRGAKAFVDLHLVRGSSAARAMRISSVITHLPIPDRVACLRQEGRSLFFDGKFESAAEIAAELEQVCLTRLRFSRTLAIMIGLGLGLMPLFLGPGLRGLLQVAFSVVILMLACLMVWSATSQDSKREMKLVALCLMLGFGVMQLLLWFEDEFEAGQL